VTLPVLLFVVFTLLATAGAYWIGAGFRSRRVGWMAAGATLLFFVGLWGFLVWLVRMGGGAS
jgi:hypothetical protein